jgi:nicotinic acid mononucleotide adenylyltransferase
MKYLREKENLRGGVRGKKIVLFAISANPPTISHLKIVEQLAENYDHVVVWTSTNPNKQ